MRLRVARWGVAPYALVLNGRSEHLEKYAPVAAHLAARGYGMISLDWRGQGLSDRLSRRNLGYVRDFWDYQIDLTTALEALEVARDDIKLLIGHSMGGLLALRALREGVTARALILTGPLLGLKERGPMDRVIAWVLRFAARIGFAHRLLPGSTLEPTVIAMPFERNVLTGSQRYWDIFHRQISTHPALGISGPTIGWAAAALREMAAARRWPAPDLPTALIVGASEDVVSVPELQRFAAARDSIRYIEVPGAEHEVLMERPEIEAQVWAEIDQLIAATSAP